MRDIIILIEYRYNLNEIIYTVKLSSTIITNAKCQIASKFSLLLG